MAAVVERHGNGAPDNQECFCFTFQLSGIEELTDEIENKVFEAGCDDATLAIHAGTPHLIFDRVADSLENAIKSAIADVEKCGLEVVRVIPPGEQTIEAVNGFLQTRRLIHRQLERMCGGKIAPESLRKLDELLNLALDGRPEVLDRLLEILKD